jgi:small subunit ribosomal protein S5
MGRIPLRNGTVQHTVFAKHGAAKVMLAPAAEGAGIIAGGPLRAIFDVMGVHNVVAKSHGSTNPYNMVRATLKALERLRTPAEIAAKRGKTVEEILG